MQDCARNGDIDLFYFDEAGISCVPNVQRSWSPMAKPHEADASIGRKQANVMGALDFGRQKLHFDARDHTIRRDDVVYFLDHLAQSTDPETISIVIMDNASMHHNIDQAILDRWLADHKFIIQYLPPYSPELNRIEILWKHAKYHWRSFASWSRDSLMREVRDLMGGFGTKFHISFA